MNRIYSLRYSAVARGFIAVSEFARKCVHKSVRRLCFPVLLLIPVLFSAGSLAGTVNNELGYQLFRDFAENKGMFRPGATNIAIYNKQGELVGTLDKAAMPDFSAVDSEIGVATLINPQYIASVKHNGGYTNVSFGDGENRYNIVDRNNAPSLDFHAPRLDKLVTEVAPTAVTAQGAVAGAYLDKERYPVFYRLGSGTQYIKDSNGQLTQMGDAYSWLTGGTVGSLSSYQNGEMISTSSGLVFDYKLNGAMPIYGEAGDSGSPLFAFDTVQNKWVLVGVLTAGNGAGGRGNNWAVIPLDFIGQKFNEDNDAPVTFRTSEGGALEWSFNSSTGAGALTQGTTTYAMHGQQGNDLNAGKNLIFQGQNGQINLKDSVSQGAGSLTFRDNYTVTTSNGSTWTGAGIVVDNGVSVNWQVNGVKGDNLHKIGEGTLTVQGTGINEGGLKVGDGKVVLNQQADNKGQVQAFSSVNIASGRPTVVLTDERQVNPDTVSWGYRGGTLDVNGNSLTFHQLKAADYGAVLANNVDKRATITLDYALRADKVALNGWSESGKGTAGNLYKYNNPYTNTTDYFILKQSTYGYFPTDQSSNATWEFVGHSQGDAQKLVADRFNTAGYLFHGQLKGNLNVDNRLPEGVTGALVMDGAADISGTFTQENGRLTLQGHPVIHAYNTQSVADKLAASGDHSVLTQPTSFSQEDWENRSFTFDRLSLKNTDFGLGRNATLNTTIQADNSSVTLGDSRVFIDKNDGQGTAFTLEEGTSVATKDADKSVFNGTVNLDNQSVLNINDIFNGGIQANNSTVNISSDSAVLGNSTLTSTALNLNKGANALASQSFVSDGPVNISDATLSLNSRPDEVSHTLLPVYDYAGSWNLKGDDARLNVGPYSMLSGNINVQDKGTVTLGGEGELSPDLTLQNQMLYSLFNGYRNTWSGSLNAPDATVSMTDTQWSMNGNSTAGNMKLNRTIVGFNGGTSPFTTLTTDNLDAVQSAFVMRTDLNKADKLVINKSATGHDNSIWVNFLKKPSDKDTLDIPLVSAPEATADNLFRASTRVVGFSDVTPTLSVRKEDGKKEWVLDGYQVARNDGQGKAAATFMHISYNNFITEVNNLNKRMGDLRDINGEAGTWVRLLNGSGSADGGFTDHYTLLQMGADRKHELGSMDLFTGVMATYTDTDASAGLYSGKTKSWGGGFYASGLFRSGAYFDLIAKYIHNENKYDLNFAGAGKQNFRSHSLYAGAEVGYRYHLTDTTFVEPQAELVWGRLQGQTFNWNDSGMDVSMRRNSVNPLVGRTGVVSGKTFSGKDWRLTARAGLHYEFDLTDSADVHLKDAAGEHQINGRKDSRMLYGVGLNARFGDNTRLGLEVERSAFGKYNTDDAINANIRYSF
ncbi:temperature-sensitive protease autotransporter hemagglutinin Tsh/Hbp [Escherichia coli]|uniref:temperature-sensitive protease autotransporter hemagglutinin Tsh/Hbp n=2 Tax=Escherichia coli TaxID=562 RepID=UPI0002A1CAD0|nr:hemoglobin-binding protease autotransporter Hbp [Escherichia coli]EIK7037834.1 hemoglobin-binding protease autotransporter Hbp [Escherichia coli]ELD87302.1 temperature-sensitive hemagglutinin tsh autotransporter [Escherichia coli KTE47]EOW33009.1 temperature-sensitive hemagglutinin tsh autotransporter [Escherichia coli KTE126]WKR82282.1 hemoglobin-binding protease autotransporter Hbp [Escherichia coli]